MSTTRTSFLVEIEDWFENGLSKLENKMPDAVYNAATTAAGWMEIGIKFLSTSALVSTLSALVPETEPAKEEIIAIAGELQKDFAAVAAANQPALILGAQAQVVNAVYAKANNGTQLSLPAAANAYVSAVNK